VGNALQPLCEHSFVVDTSKSTVAVVEKKLLSSSRLLPAIAVCSTFSPVVVNAKVWMSASSWHAENLQSSGNISLVRFYRYNMKQDKRPSIVPGVPLSTVGTTCAQCASSSATPSLDVWTDWPSST
jgi:hypothetical protein